MEKQQDIIIVGTGNVATQLGLTFSHSSSINLKGIYGRNAEKTGNLAQRLKVPSIHSPLELPSNSIIIVCIKDSAIQEVVHSIPKDCKIAITSGSTNLNTLKDREACGIFYPLQTFSKGRKIDLSNVPFLIEASTSTFEKELIVLAQSISSRIEIANSALRYQLHIAAVMVNNFTNHLYALAKKHTENNNIDFSLLYPLIQETAQKITQLSPEEAQTGPAKRGDQKIIEAHISSIKDRNTQELYAQISHLILKENKQ